MNDLIIIEELKEWDVLKNFDESQIRKSWQKVRTVSIKINENHSLEAIIEKLSQLRGLYTLKIEGNQDLTEIPKNIGKLVSLKYLYLGNNNISEIPSSINKLIHLKNLLLNHNQIEKITNISKLVNLEFLDLSNNKIKKISKDINQLTNLNWLCLNNNQIKRIENITKLINLKTLKLNFNQIRLIPKNIDKLIHLQRFFLINNLIKRIPNSLLKLNFLDFRYYHLDNNPILNNIKRRYIYRMDSTELIEYLIKIQDEISIKRIFYPIGQGAFYAEKHNEFTIVYDCGSKAPTKIKNMLEIKKVFKKNEVIDILFISHFDYDHVSGIVYLKKWTNIKKVIMPLLHQNEIDLLSKVYSVLEFDDISQLIQNTEDFFGKSTKVIRVESSGETERPLERVSPQNINALDTSIKTGTTFYIKSNYWNFIPFNYKGKNRLGKLEEELIKEGIDIEKLKTNTLDLVEKNRAKIKKAYSNLKGDINENSLVLYSGLAIDSKHILTKESYLFNFNNQIRWYGSTANRTNRISCIYTGDTNLNKLRIEHIFSHWWNTIGTIQIPHHGEAGSFDKNILRDKDYFCPLSVGTNTYGHPSKRVIEDIIAEGSYPITVNEDLSSGFVEYIDNSKYINNFREKH